MLKPPDKLVLSTNKPEVREGQDPMAALSRSIGGTIRGEIDRTLERHVDPSEMPFEKLSAAVEELIEKFSGSWDRLRAVLLGGFGMKKEAIDEAIADTIPPEVPAGAEVDKEIPPPTPAEITHEGETSYRNRKRAEHAGQKLNEHPEWRDFIGRGARRWGISLQTYVIFIEMESGFNPESAPVYKDKQGNTIRGRFSLKEVRDRGLKLVTSAHGLSQAMRKSVPTYIEERYQQFLDENGGLSHLPRNPDPHEIMYIPEVAIDFFGWHLRHKIDEANTSVRKLGLDWDKYHLSPASPPDRLYMIYNQGGLGYALLMRYLENPTQANHDALRPFQQETRDWGGRTVEGWQARKDYAERVGTTAQYFSTRPATVAWAQSINGGKTSAIA